MPLDAYQLRTRIGMSCIFADGAPTNALARVLREGECVMLGAFSLIPPSDKRGWVCRVSTRNGADRLLAIVVQKYGRKHWVIEIDQVPWEYWEGSGMGIGWSPSNGDHPQTHAQLHRIAVEFSEALRVGLSDPPKPTTHGPPAPCPVAERRTSRVHFLKQALKWGRRDK